MFRRWSVVGFLLWAREHLHFQILVFALLGLFATCASTSTCALLTPLTHSRVFAIYSTSLPLRSLPSCSPLLLSFATMVCVPPSPSLCRCLAKLLLCGPRAKATPQLWSSSRTGANKEATDEVRKRIKYTLTCDSQNGLKEEALSGLSLPRCRWG